MCTEYLLLQNKNHKDEQELKYLKVQSKLWYCILFDKQLGISYMVTRNIDYNVK